MEKLKGSELLESAITDIANSVGVVRWIAKMMNERLHGMDGTTASGVARILDMATRCMDEAMETVDGVRVELDKEGV
ncbi:MAG: hypothetical protein IJM94_02465 [Clostridia bacterium]|nr:hypothetical protein [Clostridia bacterium]